MSVNIYEYCASCSHLNENYNYGKYYCTMKGEWIYACDQRCYSSYLEAYNRSRNTMENMYDRSYHSKYYITTAVCKMLGLPEDCHQLQMIAKLKEEMKKTHNGRTLLSIYDVIGPKIAESLLFDQEYGRTLAEFSLNHRINQTAEAVEKEDYTSAIKIYAQMTRDLARCYNIGQNIKVTKTIDPKAFGARRYTRKKEITTC